MTRVWHYRGKRPRVVRQQQFISTYLYGAVCPTTGQCVGLVMPYANGECMKRHLQAISQAVPKGRHAVVVMDGAVWHKERYNLRAFFRKCVTAVWVKDKVQHDHRIQS